MKHSLLLAHRYKKIGWILLVLSLVIGLLIVFQDLEFTFLQTKVFSLTPEFALGNQKTSHYFSVNLTRTLAGILFITSCLMVGFSKEANEDEYIEKMRLQALLWAVLINYSILLLCFILIYDIAFINVMIFNIFTTLLLFILRFHYLLYKSKNAAA